MPTLLQTTAGSTRPVRRAPPFWRSPPVVLGAIALLVIALHVLVLGFHAVGVQTDKRPKVATFSTRTIAVTPPAPAPTPEQTMPEPVEKSEPKVPETPALQAQIATKNAAKKAPAESRKPTPKKPAELRPAEPAPAAIAPAASAPPAPTPPPAPEPAAASADAASVNAASADAADKAKAAVAAALAAAGGGAAEDLGIGNRAAQISGSVRLTFDVTGQLGVQPLKGGVGELQWRTSGNRYDAQLTLKLLLWTWLTQRSSGQVGPNGLVPDRFSDSRRNTQSATFSHETRQVIFSNGKPAAPLVAGAQDRLSIVMQLGALLGGEAGRYAPGKLIAVQTAGTGDAEIWIFKVDGDEPLHVGVGDFRARHLSRKPRYPGDDKIELWYAPELDWLPVRIRLTQKEDKVFDFSLRSVTDLGGSK